MVKRSSTKLALRSLVQASVHWQLDYCNAILTGTADETTIQSVQNTAACLVSGGRRRDHGTSRQSSTVSATASCSSDSCHCLEVALRRRPSILTRALCPSGQCPRCSTATICVDWVHPATTGADINQTAAELRFLWTVNVEQSAASRIHDSVTGHLPAEAEN